jgi:predicted DNA-binding protein
MTKKLNKQRCIRFADDLDERLAALAEAEDRTVSSTVNRLVRHALRSYAPLPPSHHHEATAA